MTFPATPIQTDFFSGLGNISGDAAGSLRDVLNSTRDRLVATDFEFWIDPENGSDISGDGTESYPFATWNGLKTSGLVPRIILGNVNVYVKPGTLRDKLAVDGYLVAGSLSFRAVPASNPFPSTPFPFDLIWSSLKPVTGVTGPTSGTATGGTKRRINFAGAGWTPGQLRGKFFGIVGGTNFFSSGRVLTNGADYLEVSGIYSSAFDATTEFVLAEEAVTVRPPDDASGFALRMIRNGGPGSVSFYGFRFEIQDYRYASYCAYIFGNACNITISQSSLIGNTFGPLAGGTLQVLISHSRNIGGLQVYETDLYVPGLKPGTFSGAFWAFGPNGRISFSSTAVNDNFQIYYGCPNFRFIGGSQRYRSGMLELNVLRTVGYFQLISSLIDANNIANILRFDGPNNLDCRDSILENAPGDGVITFGHHADGANLYFARTEINGCGASGIHVKGNSVVTLWNVTTDGAKLNGTWGVRAQSGSQIRYTGANTVRGANGDVNLGDNVAPVNHGVEATDTTHLTRISAL